MINSVIIFPAFVNEYNGAELAAVRAYGDGFDRLLAEASDIVKTDLTAFDPIGNNFLEDELKSQYISYVYSCAVSGILKQQGMTSSYVSGYSMGIYAALYHCGAYGFGQGLSLVRKAWELIVETCGNREYAMGMIIGLEEKEIERWCHETGDAWICNQNNPHTSIVSGNSASIQRILDLSREEGALKANLLPVSKPYHTPMLKSAGEHFGQYLETFPIEGTSLPYISCIDQKIIRSGQQVREELMRNIYCRMNWFETMNHLVGQGTDIFFECGAGDGLTRNFRFIEGEFKSLPAYRLTKLLEVSGR